MDAKRLTGVNASSLKYDLLTALSVAGLHQDGRHQISLSRLTLLITARYNWRLDEFCVGQRDLARMWNVTERTVKREIKYWLEARLVICKRRGVRGRVGAYRLNYPEIYRQSEPYWAAVGPDFQERMGETHPVQQSKVVAVDFRGKASPPAAEPPETEMQAAPATWRAACQRMKGLHPAHYHNWIGSLRFGCDDGECIMLYASNQFVAHYVQTHLIEIIMEAVEATLGPRRRIAVRVSG
ncbi:DnaA N-terminal domain-containing protein [Yoonia litorea]|uniref:DnaA N-terminal domain-containing protein n=1 Tax=Yoonia litorea TaxID=1123755 RepID=A0A1I6N2Y7_9RHOB|nr:DnaA N-terminal domain-containing protein [Yoonia litorea]SFS22313.1 DnaA N-terminal domain-containing protein [Yoonia litorea]